MEKDLKELKGDGFIKEREGDLFTVRLRVPGGRLPVTRLRKIVEVAERYAAPFVHLSVRQSLELIHVERRDFEAVTAGLAEVGQRIASGGPRVRVPVACGGCEYNPNGLVDTQRSALEVDEKLFGTPTGHHKFKVAFAGCPFDCPKSATNDVGFQGAILPCLEEKECTGCGLCARRCLEGAIVMGTERRPRRDPSRCVWCGDCVKCCPTGAWRTQKRGYTVRIGGKWGRRPLAGTLVATFLPEEKVVPFIQGVLAWYREKGEGKGRIRLGELIVTEGVDSLLDYLRRTFPEVVAETAPPQAIDTQVGGRTV